MKTDHTIPCRCGEQISLTITGSQYPLFVPCQSCGRKIVMYPPSGGVVPTLLMRRASQELANDDFTLAIVLCAMAVEASMARMFFLWKSVDHLMDPKCTDARPDKSVEELWEKEWREMRSVKKRLNELSRFLTKMDFEAFATSISFALDNHEQVFHRRNRIVHYGELNYSRADGESCVLKASKLLDLIRAMHEHRDRSFQQQPL